MVCRGRSSGDGDEVCERTGGEERAFESGDRSVVDRDAYATGWAGHISCTVSLIDEISRKAQPERAGSIENASCVHRDANRSGW